MATDTVTVASSDVVNIKYYSRDSDISGKDAFSTGFILWFKLLLL